MYLSSVSSRMLLYDFNTWELKKSYGCYEGLLRDISWSDDGKYLLQVNPKGLVEILSTADHDVRSLQHVPLRETWSASFHRDGHKNVAIGTKSGNVLIWDTKNKIITKTFPTPSHQVPVNFVSYNAKNTSLAASMQNGDTIIYGLVSNIPVLTVKLSCSRNIAAMKFHHESRALLGLATDEGHFVVRDISTNKDKAFFENVHASPVSDFAYSLINKDVVLSCALDKIMHVYDIRVQNVVSSTRTSYTLTSLGINNENQVALGAKNGFILIYDLRDLTNPMQILKDHNEEVRKVAFQPIRKKTMSTEISISDDAERHSPTKLKSPNRTSDIFTVIDSPPRTSKVSGDGDLNKTDDDFLVMMGLNKTSEFEKSIDFDRKSDKNEIRFRQLDEEKNINKSSTPLTPHLRETNVSLLSPILYPNVTTVPEEENIDVVNEKKAVVIQNTPNNQEVNSSEDLKDFIKLTMSDVADDNRNYFLHVMMVLTKQKLYLEKQMSALIENQNSLVEANRRLALEIASLKQQVAQPYIYNS